MTIRQLEYFLKLAECGNFSKAAKELYLAQPSLSQSIQNLESELNVVLFNRGSRHLTLTAEGKAFVETAKKILAARDSYLKTIADLSTDVSGTLSICAPINRGSIVFPMILPEYMRRYPDVKVVINEAPAVECEDLIAQGDADLCIINEPVKSASIEKTVIANERILLIAPPDSSIGIGAAYLEPGDAYPTISIHEITGKDFISLTPGKKVYGIMKDIFAVTSASPNIILSCGDSNTLVRLVRAGLGCSIMVDSIIKLFDHGSFLKCFYIKEWPTVFPLVIGTNKNIQLTNAATAFISLAKQLFAELY